jgi:hypothetical protein
MLLSLFDGPNDNGYLLALNTSIEIKPQEGRNNTAS